MNILIRKSIQSKCIEVTRKAKLLLYDIGNMKEFADILGIAKNTLYRRIKNNSWTYQEKLIIDELSKGGNVHNG